MLLLKYQLGPRSSWSSSPEHSSLQQPCPHHGQMLCSPGTPPVVCSHSASFITTSAFDPHPGPLGFWFPVLCNEDRPDGRRLLPVGWGCPPGGRVQGSDPPLLSPADTRTLQPRSSDSPSRQHRIRCLWSLVSACRLPLPAIAATVVLPPCVAQKRRVLSQLPQSYPLISLKSSGFSGAGLFRYNVYTMKFSGCKYRIW